VDVPTSAGDSNTSVNIHFEKGTFPAPKPCTSDADCSKPATCDPKTLTCSVFVTVAPLDPASIAEEFDAPIDTSTMKPIPPIVFAPSTIFPGTIPSPTLSFSPTFSVGNPLTQKVVIYWSNPDATWEDSDPGS